MTLNLKCQTDEFARFKSGEYQAIVVEGTRKLWENGSNVNLRDIVVVQNCNSPRSVTFEVYQVNRYTGASTLDTALSDIRTRLGTSADGYQSPSLYLAPNDKNGLIPHLYEGIHAIMIRQYRRRGGEGGKKRKRAGHTDS